jgi:hypothetical protein
MPLHLESFYNGDKTEIFINMIPRDISQAEKVFATEDKKKILMANKLFNNDNGEQFGQIVYLLMLNQDEKGIEIIDIDIVLDSENKIKIKLLDKLEESSDRNEYYEAESLDNGAHFQIETVNRYKIEREICNTEVDAYISAFPFKLTVFENIEEFNNFAGFDNSIKIGNTEYTVNGYSETMLAVGGAVNSDINEPCSFIIGKVKGYKDIKTTIGEIPITIPNITKIITISITALIIIFFFLLSIYDLPPFI